MDLYLSYSEQEIRSAAEQPLQIVKDYGTNLPEHLANLQGKLLLDDNTLISIIAAINAGFHIILYGPPGTAKSTLAEFLPVELYGAKCSVHTADSEWTVRKVIGGVAVSYDRSPAGPVEKIGPRDGYIVDDMLGCYESWLQTTDFDTVFTVIDEFNRTNMDECLGPMFTAMGSEGKVLRLEYNRGFNDGFLELPVPRRYRIICTMNKYDRTFTNELSDALSRRFKWIYIGAPHSAQYAAEEALVTERVFDASSSIQPVRPASLVNIAPCAPSPFLDHCVNRVLFDVINDLRADLELGTAYKIDAVKLAFHFFTLKLAMIHWKPFAPIRPADVLKAGGIEDASSSIGDPKRRPEFEQLLEQAVHDTVDAALVMGVVPACESLEDPDAIERNQARFSGYERCIHELSRMKLPY